jgi:hypothetical protein
MFSSNLDLQKRFNKMHFMLFSRHVSHRLVPQN